MVKTLNIRILLVYILVSVMTVAEAQDVNFSQYFNNPTYYNPAYVGLSTGLKARLNMRKQWTGLSGDFHAFSFSADIADRNIPGAGGIGFIATSVVEGTGKIKTTEIGIIPAVRIHLNRYSVIQLGALVSVMSRQVDWENLVFSDQLDPILGNTGSSNFIRPSNQSPVIFPDFSIGGIYQLKLRQVVGTFGFAVHHVTQPNQSFLQDVAPLPRKWVAHMDFIIDFQKNRGYYNRARDIKLNPGILFESQSGLDVFSLGVNAYISNIYFGAWYRDEIFEQTSFANIIWMAGISIPFSDNNRLKLMYSFDMNVSQNTNFTGPSHEISLILELDNARLINPNRLRSTGRSQGSLECSPF
jgi:type IX secretion system PorP/SprF family membrane protein